MSSEYAFSHSIREALLRDEKLVRLLGGSNVFEGYETETSMAHINVCESSSQDEWLASKSSNEAIVTLQVWTHSGQKDRAHRLVDAAERALTRAGLLKADSKILLRKHFTGTRKLPENGEYQGLLRYCVSGRENAA